MDVEGQAFAAEQALQELRQAVQASSKGKQTERLRQIESCDKLAQRVKNALESYRLEMRVLPPEEQGVHNSRLRGLEEGLKQCRTQIDWKRLDAEAASASGLRGASGTAAEQADGLVTLEQAAAVAEKTQAESKASLNRSLGMVLQAEQVGHSILVKMNEQEDQMNRIGEDMEDIKANLVRSKKLVGQIARSAASDRCIQALCVLLTIAVMVMIALAVTHKDGGQLNVPDPVSQVR